MRRNGPVACKLDDGTWEAYPPFYGQAIFPALEGYILAGAGYELQFPDDGQCYHSAECDQVIEVLA